MEFLRARRIWVHGCVIGAAAALAGHALGQTGFVNWESGHVSPLAMTPDGTRLLAVNTAAGTLEMFDISGASGSSPRLIKSIPVGIDPVSVKVRPGGVQAWVVNQISDSVSVIDLATGRVMRTILTADEPADVAFGGAGASERAFITCAQPGIVQVYDANTPLAPLTTITVQGADPRAMLTSADGLSVFVAIFGSGNRTTSVKFQDVSAPSGPYAGQNPPPNSGAGFNPPVAPGLTTAPTVAQIVKKDASGVWKDDNGRNWSSFVTWSPADNDVAIINVATLGVTYAKGMLSTVMALGQRPDGVVTPVGLDARNELRFEPNVKARFVRVEMGAFAPGVPATTAVVDLNPHLLYDTTNIPQGFRNISVGDPRGIVWHPAVGGNGRAYVSGMGSNNIILTDATGARFGEITVGAGPTGLAITSDGWRVYSLNKFDGSVSAIDTTTNTETARVKFFDPTPAAIKLGRPLLYDTHRTSGLGHASCASCHIDAKSDFIAWDLGNPAGAMKSVNQPCFASFFCTPWHPMKGPMVTQVLQGIVGTEPLHWRGDRENIAAFAPAYVGLQGADAEPSAAEMTQLTNFIATIKYPPNPNRSLGDTMPTTFPTTGGTMGNPSSGLDIFNNVPVVGASVKCITCHTLPVGTSRAIDDPILGHIPQSMKMAQLRGLHRKRGLDKSSQQSLRGYGYNHDGQFDTLDALLRGSNFNLPADSSGDQMRHDLEAFLLCFTSDTHPAVGQQIGFDGTNNTDPAAIARLSTLISNADGSVVGLIAKGRRLGVDRGWAYIGAGNMQSDRHGEQITVANLRTGAAPGNEVVFMAVPISAQTRLGIDRDEDGFYDAEEIAACSNPSDATNFPGSRGAIDVDASLSVTVTDIFAFLNRWFAGDARANFNGVGGITVQDIFDFLSAWFAGC